MQFAAIDRWLANKLPGDFLKDFYPRAMRRLTEIGIIDGQLLRETIDGYKMRVDRLDAVNWCIHYFGVWEPHISTAIRTLLLSGGSFVDIGSNVGYHALLAASCVGETGRVVAFEPCADTFARLQENIRINSFRNIQAVCAAVSDHCGSGTLHCMADNERGQASLSWRDGVIRTESVSLVAASTIDNMIDPSTIDLIKIDVEGAEDAVVSGLSSLIEKLKPAASLIVEVGPLHDAHHALRPLLERGFRAAAITNDYRVAAYRGAVTGNLGQLQSGRGLIQDVLLSRSPEAFAAVSHALARHRLPRTASMFPAYQRPRTPSLSNLPQTGFRAAR